MKILKLFALAVGWVSLAGSGLVPSELAAWQDPAAGTDPANATVELRTLNSHFPCPVPADRAALDRRQAALRLHLQVSLGLWPLPERTPLNAVIHGKLDLGDYTVEKVSFESFPGYWVTGSLYRGKGTRGPVPGVLCPHGHYTHGRFMENSPEQVRAMIERGEESLESAARSPLQARCVHLARMSCTVFHYDMVGYADSQQISEQVAHGFTEARAEPDGVEGWAFFSPRAEMQAQSIVGLQTWNSIRAVDFLQSLPEVDPDRIAVTGSSGGGTQSFLLGALDSRVRAAFPAVMVSTGMQGGCPCENGCNLRIGTGNVEIAGLFAPRPMGLSTANDWTRNFPEDGFPQLQQIYALAGAAEQVAVTASPGLPHGYNQIARRAMYEWFDRHLGITAGQGGTGAGEVAGSGALSGGEERPFRFLTPQELTVWDQDYPAPAAGIGVECAVNLHWARSRATQLTDLLRQPDRDPAVLDQWKQVARSLICDLVLEGEEQRIRLLENREVKVATAEAALELEHATWGNRADVPGLQFVCSPVRKASAAGSASSGEALPVCMVTMQSVESLLAEPSLEVRQLLASGRPFLILAGDGLCPPNRLVANGREGVAAYTYGYNRSSLAIAASTLRQVIAARFPAAVQVDYLLPDEASVVGLLASASSEIPTGKMLYRDGFRFSEVGDLRDRWFLPGGLLWGEIPGWMALADPGSLWLVGDLAGDWDQAAGLRGKIFRSANEEDRAAMVQQFLAPAN